MIRATVDQRALCRRVETDRRKAADRALLLMGTERRAAERRVIMQRRCDTARLCQWKDRYDAARRNQ